MKRKLLITATTFPAKAGDGSPEFVLTLARSLTKDNDVTVLTPRIPGAAKHEVIDGVDVHRFAYFIKPLEGLADGAILPNLKAQKWRMIEAPFLAFFMLLHTIRYTKKADVVNAHWIIPAGLCSRMTSIFNSTPYVVTVHGADAYALDGKFGRKIKRWVLNKAKATLPVSSDIAQRLSIPEANVIPMGVDVPAIQEKIGKRNPQPNEILFVGRLADKKGIDVLLNALTKVDGVKATIVGGGPDDEKLKSLAADLNLNDRVTLTGNQTAEQVIGHLRNATALIIPSRISKNGDREGTPVVMGEAMAAGVPVVASNFGGMSENVVDGKTGILVEPESVNELADAIRRITSDSSLANELSKNAVSAMIGVLDLESVGNRYNQHIEAATND